MEDKMFFSPDFLTDFIEEFKKHPALWKVKSKEYFDRVKTRKSWETLAEFSKNKIPSANVEWLKKRVHNMKSSFAKELKKVKKCERSGMGEDEMYKPKLWYYHLLLFTKNHALLRTLTSDITDLEEEDSESLEKQFGTQGYMGPSSPTPDGDQRTSTKLVTETSTSKHKEVDFTSRKRRNSVSSDDESKRKCLVDAIQGELNPPKDEFEKLGQVYACKLRTVAKINYQQYILADKMMNEIIFKALQEDLTLFATYTDPSKPSTSNWNLTIHQLNHSKPNSYQNLPRSPSPSRRTSIGEHDNPIPVLDIKEEEQQLEQEEGILQSHISFVE